MRYFRITDETTDRLVAQNTEGTFDLTHANNNITRFADLAQTADTVDKSIDDVARGLLDTAASLNPATIESEWQLPVKAAEVWAAGVTYQISEQAREEESGMADVYLDVYEAQRPEIFFKATPNHTVGPQEAIGIRQDSDWNVPEPELAIVLYRGEIVGYTVGNDVSSRAIEGSNPLYLPQAKIYDRSCAIGPCIRSAESLGNPHDLRMEMTIHRDGDNVYAGSTSTNNMVRTCEELVSYYKKHNAVPEVMVLLTGTSLVPEDEFTLQADDEVEIQIEGIGTLSNAVIKV